MGYGTGTGGPSLSSADTRSPTAPQKVTLASNIIKSLGAASIMVEGPGDADYGHSGARGDKMNAIILVGTIIANYVSDGNSLSGNIVFSVEKNGSMNPKKWTWSITEVISHFDSSGKIVSESYQYTEEQAKAFLKANEAYLMKVGEYEKMAEALGL